MEFLSQMNWLGLVIGISTFLIIGVFHPIVIKAEYHFGTRCWWWFALAGMVLVALAVLTDSLLVSALLSVTGFSCFWSILEIFEQQERVRKGWFPRNPNRSYPFDDNDELASK